MTHVENVQITPVRVPLEKPMSAAGKTFAYRDYLLVELTCSDGSGGIGFSYVGTGGGRAAAMAAEELLVPVVIGEDPAGITLIWDRMYHSTIIQGRAGLLMNGLSAIDIALWERNARAAGMPLYRYLGGNGKQRTVPAYASGGYYAAGKGLDELAEEINTYKALGFTAVKIKTGRLSVNEEEERIRLVREIIGSDGLLLLDFYNAWNNISAALPYIHMAQRYNPFWIEDPFMPYDLENYIRLAQRIPEPLATGEFHFGLHEFKQIITTGAATIIQAEAPRCGGITEWQRIAALASAYGTMVSPCWFHQLHAHLLPSIPNGLFVEYFPDNSILNFGCLIDSDYDVENGAIILPQGDGIGFRFIPEAVAEYRLPEK
ncbi:MAG: mandelate racemase/muconate lactonizing enzyme family protein [Chloroflexi bacterium]|nr:mandelate racemase/muconate lactonizing enzyme family protein [Chloroflexota bacterium]